jgi:hypothetical protein
VGGTVNGQIMVTDNSLNATYATQTIPLVGTSVITIALSPSNTTLPAASTGVFYSQTFTASGGTTSNYTFTTASSLPTGLSLSTGGVLSGTVNSPGLLYVTVTATDGNGFSGSQVYSLQIGTSTVSLNVTATSGTPQSTYNNTNFATPLTVSVTDSFGNLVGGQTVNFTAPSFTLPSAVASAYLSFPTCATTASGTGFGTCSVTATANSTAGSYQVAASIGTSTANFSLTNTAPPNLVVTTAIDDAGVATDCTIQTSTTAGTDTSPTCSLRDALTHAANLGTANIYFDNNVFSSATTITLGAAGTLNLPPYTSVTGPNAGVTVSGNNVATVFVNLGAGGTALNNLSITGVNAGSAAIGGGIYNDGELLLSNVTFAGNTANAGGGLFNDFDGLVEITNSVFSNNTATGMSRAQGGAIFNNGALIVEFTTFAGNSASGSKNAQGGAVFNDGLLEIAASLFRGNTANGTSKNAGGGALCNSNGGAFVFESTFYGNQATGATGTRGGAIVNHEGGDLDIGNSTFTGNAANQYGGGIYFENGLLEMANDIVYNNVLGSLASPTAYDDLDDTTGTTTFSNSNGNLASNYIGYYNNPTATPPTPSILLAPLGNYGGPTQTVLPLPGSPAICGGNANYLNFTTDQRGFSPDNTTYPGYNSTTPCVDAGAVQTNYSLAFTVQPSTSSTTGSVPAGTAITPSPAVAVSESGNPTGLNGIVMGIAASAGTLSGATSETTSGGVATFSGLSITPNESGETITASLSLNPALATPLGIGTTSYPFTVAAVPPSLYLPVLGTLSGSSATFQWHPGIGNTSYELRISATGPGGGDVYNASSATNTSVTVTNLPTTGANLYVRLLYLENSVWKYTDYTYTQSGTLAPPSMSSPTPGSVLSGSNVTFQWNRGSGATEFELRIGTLGPGSNSLYSGSPITGNSVSFTNFPTVGAKLYVRLLYEINDTWNHYVDYVYTEADDLTPPALTTPSPNSTLTGSGITFQWNPETGFSDFQLKVGTTGVGSSNIFNGYPTTLSSVSISNIPTTGATLYVRLLYLAGATWNSIDYTYTEALPVAPAMISPTPGSTLGGSSVNFQWSPGLGNTLYVLRVGTTGPGSANISGGVGTTSTSASLTNIPTTGANLYVRLLYYQNSVWKSIDYVYTQHGTLAAPAMTSPSTTTTPLSGPDVTFQWNAGSGNTAFELHVGTKGAGTTDLYSGAPITNTSVSLTNIPTTGKLYVSILYQVNLTWKHVDYVYTLQ